ncbi:MAG: MCE family protein [Deltaproteobacteria bacterium]|nr:MCE family protein [Deltaproteobacteria bacterium]
MRKASPTLIGAFVLGAIALAIGGVVVFGSGQFFEDRIKVIMYFRGSVNGLSVGAPLKFKGVPIGQVSEIRLLVDRPKDIVAIPVVAEINKAQVTTDLGRKADLNPESIQEFVKMGLRARLESQSLVTGLLFVGLDFVPDSRPRKLTIQSDYPEIPTLPSTLEQFNQTLSDVLKQIRQVDFAKLMDNVSKTVDGIERLVNSPEIGEAITALNGTMQSLRQAIEEVDTQVGPIAENIEKMTAEASRALASLRSTVETAQTLIEPEAPLAYQLQQTLTDVGQAARAVQNLASLLDEQPTVLIYGKERGGGEE